MAISYARSVQLGSYQPSALDQHPGVKQYFEQARAREAGSDQEQVQGSQMVEQDRPHPQLKPGQELAADVDRQSFNERWTAEQDSARQAYMERYAQQSEPGGDSRERNQDLENGM